MVVRACTLKNLHFVLGWYRAFSIDLPSLECYLRLQSFFELMEVPNWRFLIPKTF